MKVTIISKNIRESKENINKIYKCYYKSYQDL